ncbi:hypoxanthine phosphoribosyltransferase [Candidatus Woesearchaeota archaeon]|nr:hypoxanthine phosphoribosyltransferase [Candidatus Woesearchaeota archaeon]MBL7051129.1 hypoxanthine phosphoribosyltransferase [Candidatus Woesearchaeota archaeon]
MDKIYIDANKVLKDSFQLAKNIYNSGFKPDAMIVLWRGGSNVGMIINEFFEYKGENPYHGIIKAKSYTGIEERTKVNVEGSEHILDKISKGDKVLVIDDIFDSGKTVEKIKELVNGKSDNVKIATLYYKPKNNITNIKPDFYLNKVDDWIVFPHELMGLTKNEVYKKGKEIGEIIFE